MPKLFIRPTEGGRFGPLDGPFTLVAESAEGDALVETVIAFARHVGSGISFYNNKTGFADSSLFKSFAGECFVELADEDPGSAARLVDLTIDCSGVTEEIHADKSWQLYRAILATLPGVAFQE